MAFPTTPVLDTFSGTLASWTNPIFGGTAVTISGGQLAGTGASDNAASWTSPFSSGDQEVYYEVPTYVASVISLFFLIQAPGITCYAAEVVGDGTCRIRRFNNGVQTNLDTGSLTMASGDSFGASKVGATISIYQKPSAGAWTLIDSIVDVAPLSGPGQIGLDMIGTLMRFDNFGGGNVSGAQPSDDPPIGFSGRGAGW